MKNKKKIDEFYELFEDINSRVAIAFALIVIAFLLVYIAFVK